MLFALLPVDAVPEDFDVNYDEVLRGCDQGTEKSLNGPRVTEMITKVRLRVRVRVRVKGEG